jgi:flavin-dependent dehydrogenase
VARDFGLGINREFLAGIEAEYENVRGLDDGRCTALLDGKLARGYIGWIVPGYNGVAQIGLACRRPQAPDLRAFLRKIAGMRTCRMRDASGFRAAHSGRRRRCRRKAAGNVLLIGDAAASSHRCRPAAFIPRSNRDGRRARDCGPL